MKASALSFRAAALTILVGMAWGIAMAASGDHATHPGHAHLNLLGWVSLFLFGVFYRLHPEAEAHRLALPQVWIWIAAGTVLAAAVGLIHTGRSIGEPIAAIASLVLFADGIAFAWLVFRGTAGVPSSARIPAE